MVSSLFGGRYLFRGSLFLSTIMDSIVLCYVTMLGIFYWTLVFFMTNDLLEQSVYKRLHLTTIQMVLRSSCKLKDCHFQTSGNHNFWETTFWCRLKQSPKHFFLHAPPYNALVDCVWFVLCSRVTTVHALCFQVMLILIMSHSHRMSPTMLLAACWDNVKPSWSSSKTRCE